MQSGMVRSLPTSSLERIKVIGSGSWLPCVGRWIKAARPIIMSACRIERCPEVHVSEESDPFKFFPYQAIVDRPPLTWPNGARVAVWVIPNIEHFHIEIGSNAPDIRNHSRRDYGNRVGIWRIMETLAKHNVRGTVALNAEVGRFYPRIMEEAAKLNWEFMGHGLTNSVALTGMAKEQEAAVITEAREVIEQWGQKM